MWSAALGAGVSEPAPLVYDGVMYVPQPAGLVQALDATTGDLMWEYIKTFEDSPDRGLPSRMRSLAIHGSHVYVATPDAHIVALDARTGEVSWDRAVADYRLGYRYMSGPIVVKGKIVAGMTRCERYKDDVCFISAHDAQTGRELFRTSTIARPGGPGGDTWGDLPLRFRAGGDAWIPGGYDAEKNLIYWSTAQAKPWARMRVHCPWKAEHVERIDAARCRGLIVGADADRHLYIHDASTGRILFQIRLHSFAQGLAFRQVSQGGPKAALGAHRASGEAVCPPISG